MKESNILVGNTGNNLPRYKVLLNMKRHFIKESNIFVGNASNNFLRREVKLNMNKHHIKESNSLAGKQISSNYLGKPC